MTSLSATDVVVGYSSRSVLGPFSVDVRPGVTVLLGVNGVGKTTLLRTLSGALPPLAGTVLLDGEAASEGQLRTHVGIAGQITEVASWLRVDDYLAYAGYAAGRPWAAARDGVGAVASAVGLEPSLRVRTTHLSGGQRRQLALGAALMSGATTVLLDEPTAGLDPVQRARVVEMVAGWRDLTVIVSTHSIPDVLDLADGLLLASPSGTLAQFSSVPEFMSVMSGPESGRPSVEAMTRVLLRAMGESASEGAV